MLKPAIESRRRRGPTLVVALAFTTGALVGVAGSLVGFLIAPHRVVIVDEPPPPMMASPAVRPTVVLPVVEDGPDPMTATLKARVSPRSLTIDVLSPGDYTPSATLDEVVDVELSSALAVQHIFVNGNGGAHQWDTVIGGASIPFGRVFGGQRGEVTWHLGVREHGQWRTNPKSGALRELPAGTHTLELIGESVYDSPGPRTVTVMFVDGTTLTAAVEMAAPTANSYPAQAGGGTGTSNVY